ncbi:PREDICTED: abhydrolase domain-containing protein 15-like [Priapulus caudatus]|uniref:Abhydrolase domain-containing protein 15-like n=1 Tax=Priapulus caudatus TaxID=37621 RepID=A0ABM1F3Z4_PRICU|nr:PREDICTED: abhydrolase domain-containing protein 15-like [Priapulus caudatus]
MRLRVSLSKTPEGSVPDYRKEVCQTTGRKCARLPEESVPEYRKEVCRTTGRKFAKVPKESVPDYLKKVCQSAESKCARLTEASVTDYRKDVMMLVVLVVGVDCLPTVSEAVVCSITIAVVVYLLVCITSPLACRPTLHCKPSSLAAYLLKRCPRLRRQFRPTFWAANAHAQTLLGAVMPRADGVYFRREFLQMRDHGVVSLDWAGVVGHADTYQRHTPVVIVLPTLTGSAATMSALCALVLARHFRCAVFNRRGCARTPLATPRLQSYGDTADLRQVLKYLRALYPRAKISSVGAGAGAGLLISYLGDYGSSSYLTAAVCVSPPLDGDTVRVAQPYQRLLLADAQLRVARYASAFSAVADVQRLLACASLDEFECRLHGYASPDDYWERNAPLRDVDDVSVPVLCVKSLDDPLSPAAALPYDLFRIYPNLFLVTTARGGHCGFWERVAPRPWAYLLAMDYIEGVMEFTSTGESDC